MLLWIRGDGGTGSGATPWAASRGLLSPLPPAARAGELRDAEKKAGRRKKLLMILAPPPTAPHGYFEMKRMWFCKAQNLMMNVPPSSLQSSGPGYF